ncbi:hypothetical protein OPU71_08565 [Niveibacterium sp. 24ML]|uniref:hypothetical protein n=1 Tax=Niveibacterium sp. 24ML TaxID=2985512 RepID=UPI00226FFF2B|nr:hypothetical protein [Niveibacterium sp. 24ML]MCX9156174.1 hypothetical protein [Niveibacterium sp. 24ML]
MTTTPKRLLIYIAEPYLLDYFQEVVEALADLPGLQLERAAPFHCDDSAIRLLLRQQVAAEQCDLVWTTAELLPWMPAEAQRIASFHHAGYGEHRFLLHPGVLDHADLLFCASYRPSAVLADCDGYRPLVARGRQTPLRVVPVGYPKLDRTMAAVAARPAGKSVLIALSTLADNPYAIDQPLRACIERLLAVGEQVILRPFPRDIVQEPLIRQLLVDYGDHPGFALSEGSYLPAFAAARVMLFFGRPDATTAFTFSYSSLRPCLFYQPQAAQGGEPHPLGLALGDGEALAEQALTIEPGRWRVRLTQARAEALAYVGTSAARLRQVVGALLAGQPLADSYSYHRQPGDGELALATLQRLEAEVGGGSSYLLMAHLQRWLASNRSGASDTELMALCQLLTGPLGAGPAQILLQALVAVGPLLQARLTEAQWRPLWALAEARYQQQPVPAPWLRLSLLRLRLLANDEPGSAVLAAQLLVCGDSAVLHALADYYQPRDASPYQGACAAFVAHSGLWQLDLLQQWAARAGGYDLFGDGRASRMLLAYLKQQQWPLPQRVWADEPAAELFDGVPVSRLDGAAATSVKLPLLIASPEFAAPIRQRLLALGVAPALLIDLATKGG